MRRIVIPAITFVVCVIVLGLAVVPLRRADTSEFAWMVAFSVALFSFILATAAAVILTVNVARSTRRGGGSSGALPLPPGPTASASPLGERKHGTGKYDSRLKRSAFYYRWISQRRSRDGESRSARLDETELSDRFTIKNEREEELRGFRDISRK